MSIAHLNAVIKKRVVVFSVLVASLHILKELNNRLFCRLLCYRDVILFLVEDL